MLTYLSASKTVDFIINGVEEYLGVLIISTKNEEIKKQITLELYTRKWYDKKETSSLIIPFFE
jgi:uncharacterized membrane-anchored protein YitT (DUF2179 family)